MTEVLRKQRLLVDDGLQDKNVLRRYFDTAKFVLLLQTKSLFFCRADLLQDKFEGAFTRSIKELIDSAFGSNNISSTAEEFKKSLRERIFLNCWSLGLDDNMAMWKMYGGHDYAVAITTTVGQLREAIESYLDSNKKKRSYHELGGFMIKPVQYVKHWRDPKLDINPYSNIFRYKVTAYEFEQEVRVILDRYHETVDQAPTDNGVSIGIDLNKFLRSVVISPDAPDWFHDLIRKLTEKYGVNVEVRRSMLSFDPL